ncbi:MAG: CocE/NonD family hydrolase [Nitrososphaeria archaeon]|jgi:putative CocE/NonD family hydrolase
MEGQSSSKFEYGVFVEKDVMILMRDRIKLATDIYRPAINGSLADGRFPTILVRTPYNKEFRTQADPGLPGEGEFFAKRGYVYIVQDVRGRHKSEGKFYIFKDEGPDGYDTVEWIAKQPWSNGKVGTTGTSYLSWVQSAMAVYNPPHLCAMMPDEGAWNAYMSSFRHNGCFEMRFMGWAFFGAASSKEAQVDTVAYDELSNTDLREWLKRMPIKEGYNPLAIVPAYEKWFFDIFTHGEYDEYWKQKGFAFQEYVDEHSDVPIYCTGGWYDSYTRSTTEMFTDLSDKKKGPIRMLMGPWTHGPTNKELSYAGDVDFGKDTIIDWLDFRLRFFDKYLKGLDNGLDNEPPVKIFVMGGGRGIRNKNGRLDHGGKWRFENEWPIKRTRYTEYYLHKGMKLSTSPPTENDTTGTTFIYDPNNPVPTIGANISFLIYFERTERSIDILERTIPIVRAGALNQIEGPDIFGCTKPYLPLASRQDVLSFSTHPLEKDLEVTGPISVTFWVSSSAPDTDFTAKLIDVHPQNEDYPSGYAMNISDSIMRARFYKSWEKQELLQSGKIYKLQFKLYPTSNLFAAGHMIRFDISSSNYPRFDLNPNTGEPIGRSTYTQLAKNTIYHDTNHPSHILLPIIPK